MAVHVNQSIDNPIIGDTYIFNRLKTNYHAIQRPEISDVVSANLAGYKFNITLHGAPGGSLFFTHPSDSDRVASYGYFQHYSNGFYGRRRGMGAVVSATIDLSEKINAYCYFHFSAGAFMAVSDTSLTIPHNSKGIEDYLINNRILVAGDGGCIGCMTTTGYFPYNGGNAGLLAGSASDAPEDETPERPELAGKGGTQTSGGAAPSGYYGNAGRFGFGGDMFEYSDESKSFYTGSGGNGWYGGSSGSTYMVYGTGPRGGGGGSSYALTNSSHKPTGYLPSWRNYVDCISNTSSYISERPPEASYNDAYFYGSEYENYPLRVIPATWLEIEFVEPDERYSYIKYYDANEFKRGSIKYFNGTSFVKCSGKYRIGRRWININDYSGGN